MSLIGSNTFTRTVRLSVGGLAGGRVPGAYQYKFYYAGVSEWPNDPLNHYVNQSDPNNNSILYVKHPTIYQFIPNQRTGVVRTGNPEISAYLFPAVGQSVDTSAIALEIDGQTHSRLGAYYNRTTKLFLYRIPNRLTSGQHKIRLTVGGAMDSVTIDVQAGFVQITNRGDVVTRNSQRTLMGTVQDENIESVKIVRNNLDTIEATVAAGKFRKTVSLVEGKNSFRAVVRDSSGVILVSDSVSYTFFVNHAPSADIFFISAGSTLILSASGSTDPDSGQGSRLTFRWSADARNPQATIVDTLPGAQATIPKPGTPGEYVFTLIATDPDGNKDTTKNFFTLSEDGTVQSASLATVPRWVKQGRVYELFFKSLTPEGTVNAAAKYLPYLKSLGVNILWVMPIMENASPINNRTGPGYNIKNFTKVAPEYGSNEDFKNFVRQAHLLGLKVVLDVTPNHTSYLHPFILDARQFGENSQFWNYYQHSFISHNTNGLGQSLTPDGFVYYSGFSSQLLNYNWSDIDARTYMIEVYKWWVKEFDIDGYRFDVYWGPRRRAANGAGNESEMGVPVRKALKKIKPDIFLLAEDDGIGVGTEVIYADRNGGVDSGYDWVLYGSAVRPFTFETNGIDNLHNRLYNGNFYPGPNSFALRFLENHDEERIAFHYSSYEKTMPVATALFTTPGIPMVYSGQEVGTGPGIQDFYQRTRGVIDFNTNAKELLLPHYQRLAHIRAQFPAFSTQQFVRIPSGSGSVYSFVRTRVDADGIVAVNFDATAQNVTLALNSSLLGTTVQNGKLYQASDLYSDTSYAVVFSNGAASLSFRLRPYGSAVFVLSDSAKRVLLPTLVNVDRTEGNRAGVTEFRLHQNYPNPFNASTRISYELPVAAHVTLAIYNMLGEKITILVEAIQPTGGHTVEWNGRSSEGHPVASGIYFARFQAGGFRDSKKLILIR